MSSPNRKPKKCPPGFQGTYTVKSNDTMFLIAQSFGISLNKLIQANPHIEDPNVIFPGDVLCVPERPNGRKPTECPPNFQQRYTVQPGDTMFFIAQRFHIPLNNLIAANPHITNPNVIYPGDVLCVPDKIVGRQPEECPQDFPNHYTVKTGDTMFLIAQNFNVSLNDLIAANPHIEDPNVIFPGDILCVPANN